MGPTDTAGKEDPVELNFSRSLHSISEDVV